jgi:predicted nucleic acid-binding protein
VFLLDTNVVSAFRKPRPPGTLMAWLANANWEDVFIAAATAFEIERGITLIRRDQPEHAASIEAWFEGLLAAKPDLVLALDAPVARLFARMTCAHDLRRFVTSDPRSRRPQLGNDLSIAATAIVHGASIVTYDIADFTAIHALFPIHGIVDARTMESVSS